MIPVQVWNLKFERARSHLRFAKGIGKAKSLWETYEGAPRARPGAKEVMAIP